MYIVYSQGHIYQFVVNFQDKNVESLVRDVNSHMRQRQEQERLKNIIARIDSYEPIVSF